MSIYKQKEFNSQELQHFRQLQRLAYQCVQEVAATLQQGDTENQVVERFFKLMLAYFRPGFHPLDIDDSKALKNWYQITKTLDKDSVTLKQVSPLES